MRPKIPARDWLFFGYYLDTTGYTFGDAVRTCDIAIPSYREELINRGRILLTQHNSSVDTPNHQNYPPSADSCRLVVGELHRRRPEGLELLRADLAEMRAEMKDASLGRDERSYDRFRAKKLEEAIRLLEAEAEVTAEDLYAFFQEEDIRKRAESVPPELRSALDVLAREQQMHAAGAFA